jgi:hypothetical protein
MPVALNQRGGVVSVRNQTLSLRGSFRKVRRFDHDAPHPGMQALESVCVAGWWVSARSRWRVVGPEGDDEAIDLVVARLDTRVEQGGRASDCGEPSSYLDLKRGHFLPDWCYSSEHVAWQET